MSVLVQSDRETAWQAFSESCRQCQQCSLSTTRKNVVIARGRVPAPLMIIGEGPGADEDAQEFLLSEQPGNCSTCCCSPLI